MSKKIAVIGMGQMGSNMASRLGEAQFDVMGYDIAERVRKNLSERGVKMGDCLADTLSGRSIVLTSLPDPKAVKSAWLGASGIAALAEPNSLIIELSTIDPTTMKTVAAAALENGHAVLDCPVSGSPNEAGSGKLVLLVGGEEDARPVLFDHLVALCFLGHLHGILEASASPRARHPASGLIFRKLPFFRGALSVPGQHFP